MNLCSSYLPKAVNQTVNQKLFARALGIKLKNVFPRRNDVNSLAECTVRMEAWNFAGIETIVPCACLFFIHVKSNVSSRCVDNAEKVGRLNAAAFLFTRGSTLSSLSVRTKHSCRFN